MTEDTGDHTRSYPAPPNGWH